MVIELNKFGTVLSSRQSGKEALAAYRPTLRGVQSNENIELDFSGVVTLSPSWADEFITPLFKEYGERLTARPTDNASVEVTMRVLKLPLFKQIPKS